MRTCNFFRGGGFTLIEVLLSLALLIIIVGTLYSSFFTVQSALERFDGISLKYQEVRTVLDLVRREIDGALYKNQPSLNSENYQTIFVIEDRDISGRPTSRLHLTSSSFKGSGFHEISYYVQEKEESLALVKIDSPPFKMLTEKPSADILTNRGYTLEMVDEIEGFTVETLFKNKWIKTWDAKETGKLPELVRVSIEFDDNGKRVKLTEYAKPKIGRQL